MRPRSWWWVLGLLAVAVPLLRLWPLNGQFAVDWYNHKWLTAFTGEYLRQHGTIPIVVNTPTQAGMPYPVFYGTLFYPLLALPSAWLSVGLVFRLLALTVTVLQYRLVSAALIRVSVPRLVAKLVACVTIWAIYPLTNLYARAAITEYVATALLTSMVACWFLFIHANQPAERRRLGLAIGLLFALAAGTHPITALYSLPMLGLLLVAAYAEHGRDRVFWRALVSHLAIPAVLVVVALAPWIYALALYKSNLQVAQDSGPYYYAGIDEWATRFAPFPYDPRTTSTPLAQVSTPYLDGQLSVPLLVLVIGWLGLLVSRSRKAAVIGLRAAGVGLLACAFFVWISLYPSAFRYLPQGARMIQIAYRAITYQNLGLLLAVFMIADALRRGNDRTPLEHNGLTALVIGCALLAAIGVAMKWSHTTETMHVEGSAGLRTTKSERAHLARLPAEFYGYNAYATPTLYTKLDAEETKHLRQVDIPIGTGTQLGIAQPLHVSCPIDTWLDTNVQAFPWNHLEVDGVVVPDDAMRVNVIKLVVHVEPGDHTVVLITDPPTVWLVLRDISLFVIAAWLLALGWLSVQARRQRRAAVAPALGSAPAADPPS